MTRFDPHPLVRGGQLQTLAGQLFTGAPVPGPHRVLPVELADGDRLLLHVDEPEQGAARPELPIAVLMHGLGGDSTSSYILRIGRKLNRAGYTVVRFNHRGCGTGAATLARQIYHAGRVDDLRDTLAALAREFPGRTYSVTAFSLSGNLLLRYLGEGGTPAELVRAAAVCPPVDLELCSQALSARGNWHIDRYYTRRLVRTAHDRAKLFPDDEPPRFPRGVNLRVFDEVYTAPRAGFTSRAHYYDTSSARHVTGKIAVPTLLLAAADDPIIPEESFAGVEMSEAVTFRMERSGGHMGFISKGPTRYGDRRWMDQAVIEWLTG
jgi:predicted alpha/beta-fold hydrolase